MHSHSHRKRSPNAAACGLIGKQEEGGRAAGDLLALKPDFPRQGRRLIRYYIKFDDIVDRTIEGPEKCGLQVA